MVFLNSLNWSIEVFILLISDLLVLISFFLIFREFRKTKNNFFITLMSTYGAVFFSIFFRMMSILLDSPFLFKMHILAIIPGTFFGILVIDKINRFSIDPYKTLFFGICATGVIISLFSTDSVEKVELLSGDFSFNPSNTLNIWVLILISITNIYLSYYIVIIYKRTPKNLKNNTLLFSIGSFVFGFITLLLYIFRVPKYIAGLEMIPLALGILISSIALQKSQEIIKFVIKSSEISKLKYINKMLPICANCKKIRDNEGNWVQIEDYLLNHSEIRFSHGYCPDCGKKVLSEIDDKKN